ncbi:hypothetical protein HAX54_035523 [Datura stramonium]|uniref:Uncharacterized protein n=1 Tax=Datura stramonium TaxID=4076 RepID=A0ABS8VIL9_DATST|nr:hypothetical protein [Datura stramonium]
MLECLQKRGEGKKNPLPSLVLSHVHQVPESQGNAMLVKEWKGERRSIYPVAEMVMGSGYISLVNSDQRRRGEVLRLHGGEGRKMKGRAGDYFGGLPELMEGLRKMNRERGGKEVELQLSFTGGSGLQLE